MKKRAVIAAFLLFTSFIVLAQVKTNTLTETQQSTRQPKTSLQEGHYCEYCKLSYPESHFPCIMKSIKGKLDAATGEINFAAGQPISGIVVKGSKNTGDQITLTTNENGEIEFNNTAIGNYKFVVSVPSTNPNSRVAGSPIGGILVKGGKSSGSSSITLITDENGEIELQHIPAGKYKFTALGASEDEKTSSLYKSIYLEKVNP
ncbi:carboxypeptidase-like regulatory domain-containing protein [Pedobacter sp. UBA5917]|jgi:hypothetical protein|uniref:carboxypeptidase-like regulatory domain-containing protein n=1 Tax=Pedobacter sp. UBA5917 TaxID=1947061 RepID=UPI0025E165E8|nr:hypothetical protein [Pedobacter sp. UBA5917]